MTAAAITPTTAFACNPAADLIRLAAPIVAIHMGISEKQAEAQLRHGRLQVSDKAAPRLLPLLRALGLAPLVVAEQPDLIALQVANTADARRIAPDLARLTGRDGTLVLAALQRPGGLVLAGLNPAQSDDLRQQVRRLKGLRLTAASGLFDMFVTAPVDAVTRHALGRCMALMGLVPCRFSGALAAGLTAQQVAQARARIDESGWAAVNRAFQRFDLFLTGADGLPAKDVAAFLSTRADLGGAMVECVTPLAPLLIEQGLTRACARQFQADYAAIGLQTCARLASF